MVTIARSRSPACIPDGTFTFALYVVLDTDTNAGGSGVGVGVTVAVGVTPGASVEVGVAVGVAVGVGVAGVASTRRAPAYPEVTPLGAVIVVATPSPPPVRFIKTHS